MTAVVVQCLIVIVRSAAAKQSSERSAPSGLAGLPCGACHRAALCADPSGRDEGVTFRCRFCFAPDPDSHQIQTLKRWGGASGECSRDHVARSDGVTVRRVRINQRFAWPGPGRDFAGRPGHRPAASVFALRRRPKVVVLVQHPATTERGTIIMIEKSASACLFCFPRRSPHRRLASG